MCAQHTIDSDRLIIPLGISLFFSSQSANLSLPLSSTPASFAYAEVQCESPGAPTNGYAQGSPPYRAGDVIQFNCNPEYMMTGQPIIACQENGRWSGGLPKCKWHTPSNPVPALSDLI